VDGRGAVHRRRFRWPSHPGWRGSVDRVRTLLDLVLPAECGGCRAPGSSWCPECALALTTAEPVELRPRVAGVPPAWATGRYAGPWRGAVIAVKERGRRDLVGPLGAALARAVLHLRDWGELDPPELAPLALVVAPSRGAAARRRGGDPVAGLARAAAQELEPGRVSVLPCLRTARGARDSVGLSASERTENLRGRVRVRGAVPAPGSSVVLVDDVLTTGATAAAGTAALAARGVRVHAVVVLAGVQ
jgi:predicted amidophosphoribosyltransferase